MSRTEIMEFVCKHCGHTVVVNPKLPSNYTPNVCTPCWDKIEKPKHDRAMREIGLIGRKLCEALGVPVGEPLTKEEESIVARRVESFKTKGVPP